mgnify:CR=1 FL=1
MSNHWVASAVAMAIAASGSTLQAQDRAAAASDASIGEIVVTARRVAERLQDIPVAVTAISAQDIERQGLDDVTDIAAATPGFSLEAFSGPLTQPVIRGMTQLRLTSPTQNVATIFDGVYLQRNYMVDTTLIDVDRIEIIKGPQSAAYGRNAFAGAINIISRAPGNDYEGRVSVTLGNDERRDLRASVTLPLSEDRFSVRLGYSDSTFDGTWENNHPLANAGGPTDGNLGGWDKKSYNLRFVLRPTDKIEVDAFYLRTDRFGEAAASYAAGIRSSALPLSFFPFIPGTARLSPFNNVNGNPINDLGAVIAVTPANPTPACAPGLTRTTRSTSLGANFVLCEIPGSAQNRAWIGELPPLPILAPGEAAVRPPGLVVDPRAVGVDGVTNVYSGKIDIEATDSITATYQYGYSEANLTSIGNALRNPAAPQQPFGAIFGGVLFDASGNGSSFEGDTHDLRVNFDGGGALKGYVGASYATTRDVESNNNVFGAPLTLDPLIPVLVTPQPGLPVTVSSTGGGQSGYNIRTEDVRSIYGFVSYDFGRVSLSAEGRYTEEKQTSTDFFGAVQPRQVINGVNSFARVIPVNRRESDFFTPRLAATYKLTDHNMLYANVAKGVKSGGLNGNMAFAGQLQWTEEENWTAEIGSKNQFFDRRLLLNLAVYKTDWKELQTNAVRLNADGSSPTGFAIVPTVVGNLGGVDVEGVEIESQFQATDGLTLSLGASYNRSRYKSGTISQRFELAFLCNDVVCPASGDIGGNQIERVPEFDANFAVTYNGNFGDGHSFYVRGDLQYQTKMFLEEMNLGWVPDRQLVNFSTGVTLGNFDVQLWARNLFDEEYVSSALALIGTGGARTTSYAPFLGDKRTFGLTGSFKF